MKIVVIVLIMIISSLATGFFFPWWSVAVCAFAPFCLVKMKNYFVTFILAFLTIFFFWSFLALYIDIMNKQILSQKVIQLFFLPASAAWLLIPMTGFIGGILAGMSAILGKFVHDNFHW